MLDKPERPPIPRKQLILISILLIAGFLFQYFFLQGGPTGPAKFDGARAYDDVTYQLSLGPRIPGTKGHEKIVSWISNSLPSDGWQVEIQKGSLDGQEVENIVAKKGSGSVWVILGAHYDTRQFADQDPEANKRTQPVPGANDGGSGVAVLMELARVLSIPADTRVWLVFFDTEDQGGIDNKQWIVGSRYFAEHLDLSQGKPDAVVVLDMIGDADLNIHQEMNSDKAITAQIWQAAKNLGYDRYFIPDVKHSMLDDHTPFLNKGIPAVDLIDFDYPQWHTLNDDASHVSAGSLQVVGDTILAWLAEKK